MGDYYTRLFQSPFDDTSLYQTTSDFTADIKLPILYRCGFIFFSYFALISSFIQVIYYLKIFIDEYGPSELDVSSQVEYKKGKNL